ncbi:MAG: glycosyltransferase family 87 protein [Spirochaetota bacterium]
MSTLLAGAIRTIRENGKMRASLIFFAAIFIIALLFPLAFSPFVGKAYRSLDWFPMSTPGGDYQVTYDYLHRYLSGTTIYDKAFTKIYSEGHLSYPPLHALIFVPIVMPFTFSSSYAAWRVIIVLLTVLSLWFASRIVAHRWLAFVFLVFLYLSSTFMQFTLERGQTDVLILFLTSVFLYCYLVRKNTILTALFFTLAACVKLFPAVFIVFFLVRKDIKVILWSALFFFIIVFATGWQNWVAWGTSLISFTSGIQIGHEVDHSFTYLMNGLLSSAPGLAGLAAKGIPLLLFAVIIALTALKKDKRATALLEIAVISVIVDMMPPWAANYKLITLAFLFLLPFHVLQTEDIGERSSKYHYGFLFLCFLLITPLYNETYARLPYSFIALITPLQFMLPNPLQTIVERRVAIVLVLLVLYMIVLAGASLLRERGLGAWIERLKRPALISGIAIFACAIVAGAVHFALRYKDEAQRYRTAIAAFGVEKSIADGVAVCGYTVQRMHGINYEFEIIYRLTRPMRRHWAIFLHGRWADGSGNVQGMNFYPDAVTMFWPRGRYTVIRKTVQLTPCVQNVIVGFFDLSSGNRFGTEAPLGRIDLGAIHTNALQPVHKR